MNLIMFGPPGAGKGTQAQNLVKKFKYYQLSTGDLLREEIRSNTKLGNLISDIIGRGELVTNNIVDSLLEKIISNPKYNNKIIFDGYPRNLTQAKNLDILLNKYNQKIGLIIYLNVDINEIQNRIKGRVVCDKCNLTFNEIKDKDELLRHDCGKEFLSKRSDDNDDIIIRRYDTYMDVTKPVLDYYSSNPNFVEIDGLLKIDKISSKIEGFVNV